MSSSAPRTLRRLRGWLLLALAAGVPAIMAQAQDTEAARRAMIALEARSREAGRATDSVVNARTATLNDSLRAAGRVVRFGDRALLPGDRQRMDEALTSAHRSLEERFGTGAAALTDTLVWELRSPRVWDGAARVQLRAPTADGDALTITYLPPVPEERVSGLALQAAGIALVQRHPTLALFAPRMTLEESGTAYGGAVRSLALSTASVGGRCAAGALGACRIALGPSGAASALSTYYVPADYRAVVAASASARQRRDSLSVRQRERCLDDDDDASCEALVHRLNVGYPFLGMVRETFAAHALEVGGAAGLVRLDSARGQFQDDPISLLTYVSGVSESALFAGWRTRLLAAAARESRPPIAPVLFSTLLWSGFLFFVAVRRRPR